MIHTQGKNQKKVEWQKNTFYISTLLKAQLCLKALLDVAGAQDEMVAEENRLDQAEEVLGEHLTGGVVQGWRQVQKRLGILSRGEAEAVGSKLALSGSVAVHTNWNVGGAGPTGTGTDQDKLLARLEAELQESQQLVRLQQQLLQVLPRNPLMSRS